MKNYILLSSVRKEVDRDIRNYCVRHCPLWAAVRELYHATLIHVLGRYYLKFSVDADEVAFRLRYNCTVVKNTDLLAKIKK